MPTEGQRFALWTCTNDALWAMSGTQVLVSERVFGHRTRSHQDWFHDLGRPIGEVDQLCHGDATFWPKIPMIIATRYTDEHPLSAPAEYELGEMLRALFNAPKAEVRVVGPDGGRASFT